jgi:hypothetical protein
MDNRRLPLRIALLIIVGLSGISAYETEGAG